MRSAFDATSNSVARPFCTDPRTRFAPGTTGSGVMAPWEASAPLAAA